MIGVLIVTHGDFGESLIAAKASRSSVNAISGTEIIGLNHRMRVDQIHSIVHPFGAFAEPGPPPWGDSARRSRSSIRILIGEDRSSIEPKRRVVCQSSRRR